MKPSFILLALSLAMALMGSAGCSSTRHIEPYKPRERNYTLPVQLEELQSNPQDGSLWSQADRANYLYADQRAIRTGDIVTVRVEEFATASRGTSTSTSRTTEMNADINAFLGLVSQLKKLDPSLSNELAIEAGSKIAFQQNGETGRSEKLTATVQVIVKQTLPNGNLFVEGHRVILVNEEEHHFYVSGVARPFDIDEFNSIASSRLADAEIEFTGRGVLSDGQEPGVLARFFGKIWPF